MLHFILKYTLDHFNEYDQEYLECSRSLYNISDAEAFLNDFKYNPEINLVLDTNITEKQFQDLLKDITDKVIIYDDDNYNMLDSYDMHLVVYIILMKLYTDFVMK